MCVADFGRLHEWEYIRLNGLMMMVCVCEGDETNGSRKCSGTITVVF